VKGELLYEGKAKKIYQHLKNPDWVIMDFKDSLTAFNAQKKGSFPEKGKVNTQISTLIFKHLKSSGIGSHWIENLDDHSMVVQKVKIIPLEVVVRNRIAGSLAKKMGKEEGLLLKKPLVEFYYKDDSLNDPFLSDDQVLAFELADAATITELKALALKVDQVLLQLFNSIKIDLIDFKLEFGTVKSGQVVLADEITPDGCRLWDQQTGEKLDKDRFRRDLGMVKESYLEILNRLKGIIK
jgi:phosphoribosylaminoimidazole-succinocarboxamide synthase